MWKVGYITMRRCSQFENRWCQFQSHYEIRLFHVYKFSKNKQKKKKTHSSWKTASHDALRYKAGLWRSFTVSNVNERVAKKVLTGLLRECFLEPAVNSQNPKWWSPSCEVLLIFKSRCVFRKRIRRLKGSLWSRRHQLPDRIRSLGVLSFLVARGNKFDRFEDARSRAVVCLMSCHVGRLARRWNQQKPARIYTLTENTPTTLHTNKSLVYVLTSAASFNSQTWPCDEKRDGECDDSHQKWTFSRRTSLPLQNSYQERRDASFCHGVFESNSHSVE